MSHFLTDQRVSNLALNADNLRQISAIFEERERRLNEDKQLKESNSPESVLHYVIRFDNKGYRVFSLADLLQYFNQAIEVERVVFTVETHQSLSTNRAGGTCLELRLDQKDANNCVLYATADDKDWVDASCAAVHDVLGKCRNKNGWVRTTWTQLGVQITGVTLGFIFSLWAAAKIASMLAIENSFVISFLFVLLIFSNTWTYLNFKILWLLDAAFPNITFYRPRKERVHWLVQAVIGGIVIAVVLFLFNLAFSFFLHILSDLAKKDI